MRRHVYATDRARKVDQLWGGALAALVNVALLTTLSQFGPWLETAVGALLGPGVAATTVVALLPWVTNGALVALLLLRRPEMGIGYLGAFAAVIGVALAVGVVFIGSCIVGLVAAFALGPLSPTLGAVALWVTWGGVMLWGLYVLGTQSVTLVRDWWRGEGKAPGDEAPDTNTG